MTIDQELDKLLDKLLWRGTVRDQEVRKLMMKREQAAYERGYKEGRREVERKLDFPHL